MKINRESFNRENEDSASSTIVGDHSLSSGATTHSYQQQLSSNPPSLSARYNNDSGLYDLPSLEHSFWGASGPKYHDDVNVSMFDVNPYAIARSCSFSDGDSDSEMNCE